MKTTLTIEQSQHLIELGVDGNRASETYVGRYEVYSTGTFADPESCEPLFTLVDLLELLPKEIHDKEMYEDYYLSIETDYQSTWLATYRAYTGGEIAMELAAKVDTELADALYFLLCWVIENGYYHLTPNSTEE